MLEMCRSPLLHRLLEGVARIVFPCGPIPAAVYNVVDSQRCCDWRVAIHTDCKWEQFCQRRSCLSQRRESSNAICQFDSKVHLVGVPWAFWWAEMLGLYQTRHIPEIFSHSESKRSCVATTRVAGLGETRFRW